MGDLSATFSSWEDANKFRESLANQVGIQSEVHTITMATTANVADDDGPLEEMYDVIPSSANDRFRVAIYYRLLEFKYRRPGELPDATFTEKSEVLGDELFARAIAEGRWEVHVSPNDLSWYREITQLTQPALDRIIAAAEQRFYKQHSREFRLSLLLGVACSGAAVGMWYLGGLGWKIMAGASGVSGLLFLVFALIRKLR